MRRNARCGTSLLALVLLVNAHRANAQQSPDVRSRAEAQQDPFTRVLFLPELIMQHQREIGLTDAQRQTITSAMQQMQARFVDLQFKLSGENEKLSGLLKVAAPNESQVLAQLDRILALERELKRSQVGLLVRLKNTLTPQQQGRLAQLR